MVSAVCNEAFVEHHQTLTAFAGNDVVRQLDSISQVYFGVQVVWRGWCKRSGK